MESFLNPENLKEIQSMIKPEGMLNLLFSKPIDFNLRVFAKEGKLWIVIEPKKSK